PAERSRRSIHEGHPAPPGGLRHVRPPCLARAAPQGGGGGEMIGGTASVGPRADPTSGDTVTTSPDPAFAGRTYPAGPVHTVSAAKIVEFARATGAPSPLHTDPEAARAAGHADVVAPPTFLVSLAQATEALYVEDPAAGIDFSRVVH